MAGRELRVVVNRWEVGGGLAEICAIDGLSG